MRKIIIEVPEYCSKYGNPNQQNCRYYFTEFGNHYCSFYDQCGFELQREGENIIPCPQCQQAEVKND